MIELCVSLRNILPVHQCSKASTCAINGIKDYHSGEKGALAKTCRFTAGRSALCE